MKKYLSIILLIGTIIVGTLVYNAVKVDKEVSKYFSEAGYILQSKVQDTTNQTIERYYFKEETKYKQKYNETVSFNNSEGENIVANTENFIHYSNGSISSFKNGVILNLEDIDKAPIYYYNIKAGNILKKQNNTYVINNLEKELRFESLIWKISSQKYIILSNDITLKFDDGTTNQINGYLELEYTDNEVVKIYNQEVTYKTISSEVSISFPDNIILNVSSKTISKDNENKMNLENMVIDSDDNVTIVDLTEEKNKKSEKTTDTDEEEKNENNSSNNNSTNNNQNSNVSNNQGNVNGGIISGNQNQENTSNSNDNSNSNNNGNSNSSNNGNNNINSGNDSNINNGSSDSNEDDYKETVTIKKEPKYKIEEFEVNPLGVRTSIAIEDEENLLTEKSTVKILKNKTGKTVYETESELGEYNIYLEVLSLDSDTEYTLVVSSSYDIDGITYNKDFISKIFRTTKLGISLKKEVFTDTSMEFAIKVEKDSNIKSFEVVIKDENDEIIETKTVECSTSNEKNSVEFTELTPNTKYNVSIKNVLYNSQIITNGFELEEDFSTLKSKPTLTGTEFEINKRENKFVLRVRNVKDDDNAIQKYQFKIYDTRTAETDKDGNIDFNITEPIMVVDSKTKEITLNIDDEKIFRNIGYTFKLVAIGYDNEKECEYESEYSNVFKMDGEQFPTIRFEETKITFERIQGKIIVDDPGETIHLTDDTVFKITYKDSSGTIKSFTSQGSYVIPVDVNNLRANETYQFSVYTTIDLNDGNPAIDECFIGGILLKTAIPQNMVANFIENKTDAKSSFKINMQLKNEKNNQEPLEAETLTGIVFSIYSGQAIDGELPSKTPLRTIKMVDSNTAPYESDLKEKYFDNSVELTPEFFGAQNKDFKNQYYTITITNAYDYTDYKNNLPILNNVYVIRTNGYMPDLPTDPDNAVEVTTVRNRDNTEVRSDLNAETVVGYKTKAEYNNSDLYAKKVIYKAYDAKTNLLIKTIILDVGSDGVIPTAFFEVLDGTEDDVIDSDELRRGNSYYFTYEMLLDLNKDGQPETVYPYEEEGVVLRSKTQTPLKQDSIFITYPSTSDENSIEFKYKCKDIDNTIVNSNKYQIKLDKIVIDQVGIEKNTESYQTLSVKGLYAGDLQIGIIQKNEKDGTAQEKNLISQKFEGVNKEYSNLKYKVDLDANRVIVKLIDDGSGAIDRIAALKIRFSEVDGNKVVEKDLRALPDTNIIGIGLNDLSELLNSETLVEVFAYYDMGNVGYELKNTQYFAYQAADISEQALSRYYTLNENGKFVESTTIRKNMYTTEQNDREMTIKNVLSGKTTQIQLDYSESGFKYQGNVILPKKIELQQITNSGNNKIRFDLIIPGISINDIQSELDKATLKTNLVVNPATNIVDDKIYMEIYETDENGIKQDLLRTEEKYVNDFSLPIEVTGLEPKKYYFVKFRTKIKTSTGRILDNELYDIDYQVSGKQYYFSTLATVGISNIEVTYIPTTYYDKKISIKYNLEKVTGYSRIDYKIYHYNIGTKKYELFNDTESDIILKKEMSKTIDITPGCGFVFGDKYKVEIVPIAEYYSEVEQKNKILELGKEEKEFLFDALETPLVAIRGNRTIDNSVEYRITIYDEYKTIKDEKYKIRILDGMNNDITPDECLVEYDTNIKNNSIILKNAKTSMNYTIVVTIAVDLENSGENIEEKEKIYTVHAVNQYGISTGTITVSSNSKNKNKIDLVFNDTYKLTEIDTIKYSIYNTSGYAENIEEKFIPVQYEIKDTGDVYYICELIPELQTYGKYIIEIQFIKNTNVIETQSLEYIYRQ